ncbi:MAG: adenosylmethionine decarboxylase [Parcubacteria group bacterium]|nr:adenosylmethionine decarboxylase [Parcubacteria group bacterium]
MEYGKHYLVEVVARESRNMGNKKFIEKLMTEIVEKLSMTALKRPDIFKFPHPGGITGFHLIAESHVSIHTWPEKKYFSLDVFSCRDFDEKKVQEIIYRKFRVADYYHETIERGLLINFKKSGRFPSQANP